MAAKERSGDVRKERDGLREELATSAALLEAEAARVKLFGAELRDLQDRLAGEEREHQAAIAHHQLLLQLEQERLIRERLAANDAAEVTTRALAQRNLAFDEMLAEMVAENTLSRVRLHEMYINAVRVRASRSFWRVSSFALLAAGCGGLAGLGHEIAALSLFGCGGVILARGVLDDRTVTDPPRPTPTPTPNQSDEAQHEHTP